MSEEFASLPLGNAMVLCVGGITRTEAEAAENDSSEIDGHGVYLFLADESSPRQPVQLLAKFFSPYEAGHLSRILSRLS